ncbi:MAG: EamA family transporter RarD [Pseudomonadota bacterium]|jgi:chloramphenicol-sensitive protein RarD
MKPGPQVGTAQALGGFVLWGLFPLYFVLLDQVAASEVLAHRILWSALLLGPLLAMRGRWRGAVGALRQPRRLGFYALTAVLVSANWLIYIWATQNAHVIDASMGYFINPLISVLLALVFLGERLRRGQWLAVGLAAIGVGILVGRFGAVPWIALSLAFTFGGYGLLRKKAALPAMDGLLVETLLLAPVALLWLGYLASQGQLAFGAAGPGVTLLLALAGVVTVLPLALFLSSLQHLRLSTVGIIQYVTPTLQFLCGLALGEPLAPGEWLTFVFIWLALAVFTIDALRHAPRQTLQPLVVPER